MLCTAGDFLDKPLRARIVVALKGIKDKRPADPHTYLAAVLRGEDAPDLPGGNQMEYFG